MVPGPITMTETKELSMNNNRLLYSAMYNMVIDYEICIDTEHFPNEILLCSCSIQTVLKVKHKIVVIVLVIFQYNTDEYNIFPYCT
jgi:hypothetical protein